MATFTVNWQIDIEADTPEEAARQALEIQRDPDSIALEFSVAPRDEHGMPDWLAETWVDLLEQPTDIRS